MDELTLNEFRELTGVGITTYGIYHISEAGISVAGSVEMTDLNVRQQHELSRARKPSGSGLRTDRVGGG